MNTRAGNRWPLLIIYIAISCLLLIALTIAVWFSISSYVSLVHFVTNKLHRPDLTSLITKSLFTEKKYRFIYSVHWVIYPVIISFAVASYMNAGKLFFAITQAEHHLKLTLSNVCSFFKNESSTRKIFLFVAGLAYVIAILYNNHLKPISYDEAWGFNYYINKPFYFPIILFNTYPLFNLITHFFNYLPFDTLINIRLSTLLFGLLSLVGLYYTFIRRVGFLLTSLSIFVLFASPFFFIYSSLSRGITLSLFLSIIVFHLVLQLVQHNFISSRYKFLYIAANVLGIISMPTFTVFTICNTAFIVHKQNKNKQFTKGIITSFFTIFSLSILFYFPVIMNAGLDLLKHNDYYSFNILGTLNELSAFIAGSSALIYGHKYVAMFVIPLSIFTLYVKAQNTAIREMVLYSLFTMICTIVIRILTGNIFPVRSLNYLAIPFIIFAISVVSTALPYLPKYTQLVFKYACLYLLILSFFRNQRELLSPPEDKDAKVVAEVMLANNFSTAYIDEEDFWLRVPMINYYYWKKQKEISFKTSFTNSTRYKPLVESDRYDCIITEDSLANNLGKSYIELGRTNSFVLWKRM